MTEQNGVGVWPNESNWMCVESSGYIQQECRSVTSTVGIPPPLKNDLSNLTDRFAIYHQCMDILSLHQYGFSVAL